jgi:predicted DNA-binding transcriptional regulator AlpA
MQVEMYNIKTFCAAFGLKESYFYLMKKRGEAPAITKIGSKTMIKVSDAKKWMRSLSKENAA